MREGVAQCPHRALSKVEFHHHRGVVDNFGCEIEVAGVEALCCGSEDKVIIRLVQLPYVDMGRVDFVGAGLGEVVEIVEQGCASDVSAMGGDVKAQDVVFEGYKLLFAVEVACEPTVAVGVG